MRMAKKQQMRWSDERRDLPAPGTAEARCRRECRRPAGRLVVQAGDDEFGTGSDMMASRERSPADLPVKDQKRRTPCRLAPTGVDKRRMLPYGVPVTATTATTTSTTGAADVCMVTNHIDRCVRGKACTPRSTEPLFASLMIGDGYRSCVKTIGMCSRQLLWLLPDAGRQTRVAAPGAQGMPCPSPRSASLNSWTSIE